ncbi:heat-inducible transcriptional repressor HrcA [Thermoflavimicrobium dichotomicum]|uniref:Heat-inducible transcription repressor HrcA n=1 Tax=Thermoflavimicrobium dichotomicum TaxID=46223 RepID=A0A1I3NJ75_9BACL|nr:heat-inducible transcriptional repressor HrcA [Thermoflavimicrobium dichotomicum]SFJ09428.1 heat-inducible transcriptional repressor [Thermoflavimicrobium dichotomicum]
MLTERQKRILWAVIDDYIVSAEPVGSRTVSKKEGVGFSAATVRNEMADLEEMGYLEQPHTSAGRIPSQKGYRFYVDHLLTPQKWTPKDIMAIHQMFSQKIDHVEQAIQHTSNILSQLTNYMTICLGPRVFIDKLKHLQVVPLSDRSAVSIAVTDRGHVQQQRITIPENVSFSTIERLVNLLNDRLKGVPLSKLKTFVARELTSELKRHIDHYENTLELLDQILHIQSEERIYTSGTTKMLEQPEFQDVEKMKMLLDFLEEDDRIIQLLEPSTNGIQVRIGDEIHIEEVNHCSIITASYMIDGEPVGTIGVLGPTRMNYRKVISLIDILSQIFSKQLNSMYEGK